MGVSGYRRDLGLKMKRWRLRQAGGYGGGEAGDYKMDRAYIGRGERPPEYAVGNLRRGALRKSYRKHREAGNRADIKYYQRWYPGIASGVEREMSYESGKIRRRRIKRGKR